MSMMTPATSDGGHCGNWQNTNYEHDDGNGRYYGRRHNDDRDGWYDDVAAW
jgi:hypothetical protein